MRPRLSRAPGLLLCAALVIAPNLAWAAPAPIRANLGQKQVTETEVRWQPITQTETVTEPWQLTGSTTRVERSLPQPLVARYQEIRTDSYRQRTTTFPLEAKEQRTKTTTTQDYELRTYAEQSTSSTVMVPVTKEEGEWVTTTVDKPVTTPIQVVSNEPFLTTEQVPVYKDVTVTYSIPPQPLMLTIPYTKVVTEAKQVTVAATETTTTTQRVRYNGRMIDATTGKDRGTVEMWKDEKGITVNCPDLRLENFGMSFTDSSKRKLTYSIFCGTKKVDSNPEPNLTGNCVVTQENGVNYLEFDGDPRYLYVLVGNIPGWGQRIKVKLDNLLAYDKTVQTTRDLGYTKTITKNVDTPYPATCSVQLETRTNSPQNMRGAWFLSYTFYWRHYHHKSLPCPYEPIAQADSNNVWSYGSSSDEYEFKASIDSPVVGKLAARVEALDPNARQGFTLVSHRTDALPVFADDFTPASIGTRQEQVLDHYETKQVWSTKSHMVTKQVPVQGVVRWVDMGLDYSLLHSHKDPTIRCEEKYLKAPGNAKGGYSHTRKPEYAPLVEKVTSTAWATRSVTVMEPRTVTSTVSVLVGRVPGQDISVSHSLWSATGEKRRVGSGTVTETTRSTEVAGRSWMQDLVSATDLNIAPLKAQPSSYVSDLTSGTGRQSISGSSVRRLLKTKEAISSKPQVMTTSGSLPATGASSPSKQGNNGGMSSQSADRNQSPKTERSEPNAGRSSDSSEEGRDKDKAKKGK